MSDVRAVPEIPLSEPSLGEKIGPYLEEALTTGWISAGGPLVKTFEARMASHLGIPQSLATINGTAALHIALILAGVQPGDEVIVPSLTFIASINTIRYVGAVPVFWDSEESHWNADPALLPALITPRTKAILCVHLYGHPVAMDSVLSVAQQHELTVIEDAAEALGATWKDRPCGTIGDIGCFSFNGNKILTTGGGGLLITQDPHALLRAASLINQAKAEDLTFTHREVGFNYRLSNLHAAIGLAQLEQFPEMLSRRGAIFERYDEVFRDCPGLTLAPPPPQGTIAPWIYVLGLDLKTLPGRTGLEMAQALNKQGILARPFFKPGHLQPPYRTFQNAPLPQCEKWHEAGLCLPASSTLTLEQQTFVIETVRKTLQCWQGASSS